MWKDRSADVVGVVVVVVAVAVAVAGSAVRRGWKEECSSGRYGSFLKTSTMSVCQGEMVAGWQHAHSLA